MKIWVHLCDLTFKQLPHLPSSDDQAAMWLCPKALGWVAQTAEIRRGGSATCKSLSKHTCIRRQNNACTFVHKLHCDIRLLQRSNTAYTKGGASLPAGHVVVAVLEAGRGVHVITQLWRRAFRLPELESAQCCETRRADKWNQTQLVTWNLKNSVDCLGFNKTLFNTNHTFL